MKNKLKIKIFLFCLLTGFLLFSQEADNEEWTNCLKKLSDAYFIVTENYHKEINKEKLIYSAIEGLLNSLDPHSHFYDPKMFEYMKEEQQGKFYGLGIQIQKQEDKLVVISPLEGTPAYRMGIQAGDIITHINGESTKEMSDLEAVFKLRGPKGTKVNITIHREGLDKPINLTIIREEIPLYSIPYSFMLTEDIGYIFIRSFTQTTTEEFEKNMKELKKKGMKKLILDLRYNSGGSLKQAVEIVDEFIPKGKLVVSIRGRKPYHRMEYYSRENNQYENIPLVILINKGSASASEIVAGALRDYKRAILIGETTWGKGLVQTLYPVTYNTALVLTTAQYFTPSGKVIQRDYSSLEEYFMAREVEKGKPPKGGISPDIYIESKLPPLVVKFINKGLFFRYARKFVLKKTPLSKNINKLDEIFEPGKISIKKEVLDDFKFFIDNLKIKYKLEEFNKEVRAIKREILREVISAFKNQKEGMKAYRLTDPVVKKAIQILKQN
ncbi:S41 family peptidase [Candidatus Aminicenantes bacterium AC-335-A11]|jgi:carboxyl-terminal processing protease|nr:S41 family peptidase [SCandidatus Aminicenantes bacterium Aminicenantia_JdfR_composite]MCP2598428.1 S41 family peptidase [Candidatus Aminicenantes bacterium AC-335-L06]MCP2618432.1 S41 family peptidase [Candidatus Aminicenantes bacterium AC-335-A11]